jgi:tRNA pseudouridine13 synthase
VIPHFPRAWGDPAGRARIRYRIEDFQVTEQLGFDLSGEGEHCFLFLEKRGLNTLELVQRLSALSGVPAGRIGFSGLKDRNAVTRQWFSVGMAGLSEPDWKALQSDDKVAVLAVERHRRKLRRGVHKRNRFTLVLRELAGERDALEARLQTVRDRGVPNYFGEQRFGRNGSTLDQALHWMRTGARLPREKRGLYLSALRARVFNQLLAERVEKGDWNAVQPGDVCMLRGSRSFFTCEEVGEEIRTRAETGDLHPGLPLWGLGATPGSRPAWEQGDAVCDFLESSGAKLAWRPARLVPDDFCWQFCDDDVLQLDFALGAGSYATALLAEFVHYNEKEGHARSGGSSEQA